jgi:hypothetical protein
MREKQVNRHFSPLYMCIHGCVYTYVHTCVHNARVCVCVCVYYACFAKQVKSVPRTAGMNFDSSVLDMCMNAHKQVLGTYVYICIYAYIPIHAFAKQVRSKAVRHELWSSECAGICSPVDLCVCVCVCVCVYKNACMSTCLYDLWFQQPDAHMLLSRCACMHMHVCNYIYIKFGPGNAQVYPTHSTYL